MDIIREPKGVDFLVARVKRSKADIELVSLAIAHYKLTGEKLTAPHPNTKQQKGKKEKNTKS